MNLKSLVLLAGSLLLAIPSFAESGGAILAKDQITKSAAGGTVTSTDGAYAIAINGSSTTVAALAGTVAFTTASGEVLNIDIGTGLVIGADGKTSTQSLKSLITAEGANGPLATALKEVLATVSANAARGDYGKGATSVLAALTKVLSQANPEGAADYVAQATAAVTSPNSGAEDKALAAQAILEASGQQNNAEVRTASATAAQSNGVTLSLLKPLIYTTPITPIDPAVVSPSGGR